MNRLIYLPSAAGYDDGGEFSRRAPGLTPAPPLTRLARGGPARPAPARRSFWQWLRGAAR